jgi:hypothetical protein
MAGNPYLQDQANAITNQANQNLMNYQLPSINSGAMMAGGFGGSRQGIAQGLAIGQTNQGITNSLAGLYGNAYAQDQQLQTQRDMQSQSLAAQERMAAQQNQTQRDLGFGNLGLGYTQAGNQFTLGLGNLGLGNRQADQSYALGQRAADTNQFQAQTQRDLGIGNLGLGQMQAQNNYNLGLGQLGLGQFNAETNRGLGYGQLAQQGEQNNFNNQLAGFNSQLQALNALQGWNAQGVGLANQQQQIPLQNLGQLAQIGAGIGGQGWSSTTPGASTVGSAMGGALTAAQLWNLLSNANKQPGN